MGYTKEDIIRMVEEEEIEFIRMQFVDIFGQLKNVKLGDIVKYKTSLGTKTYKVTFVGAISYTDYSYLNEMGDNRITLITCIANQPSLRLCVQAVEIR